MKKITIVMLVFCMDSTSMKSQSLLDDPREDYDLIFSRNHFSVSIMTGLSIKSTITANQNLYHPDASNQIAFGGGIDHHYNINKNLSIIAGLHLATVVRNFEYYIPANAFNPPYSSDVFESGPTSTEAVFLLRLPASVEYRFLGDKKRYWYLQGGASLMYAVLQEEEIGHFVVDANNQFTKVFSMELQTNNNNKPWLNYHIGGGHSWLLKNGTLITAGILANLSLKEFTKGNYKLGVPGQSLTEGSYTFRGSYIGLTGSYIFTGAIKKIKKIEMRRRS
jgi:hypothetical protein